MKRFRFPLGPVLVVRTHAEARAREALAAALAAQAAAEAQLAWRREGITRLGSELTSARRGSFAAGEAESLLRGYDAECRTERQEAGVVANRKTATEQRRGELVTANRALRMVERLEEAARLRHRWAQQRAEQAELDEFAGQRAGRRTIFP
jgi:flagellar export protein FliJ